MITGKARHFLSAYINRILIIFERIESALIKSKKHFFNLEHSGVIFGFIC